MKRVVGLTLLGLVLTLPATARADDLAPDTWRLTYLTNAGTSEVTPSLFKVETKDGRTSGTMTAGALVLQKAEVTDFTVKGKDVRITFKVPAGEMFFQGRVGK